MNKKFNREYRSDVFCMLLEYPENALSLFNAMNESDYTDPDVVEICTMENGVSLTVRNDASFIIDNILSLYEHQSTVCPNMPLRILYYVSDILKRITSQKDIFDRKLVKIPTPRFVVFYNGNENQPERSVQRLSDAFMQPADSPELELICHVYNINPGNNENLFAKCRFLYEYMVFIEYVRENIASYGKDNLTEALSDAIDRAIKDNILKDFLTEKRPEVMKVMVVDYTYERRMELIKQDYIEEGIERGRFEQLVELVKDGLIKISDAANRAKMSVEEFELLLK
ncbi:MAG: Rpn family recombination-promoting nuclease/putative transposase [Lachnospiraceae bacterium]|nr:Rpn family recombination-promoting nuclease/putative transposase [Lachnospiraceae bacterium]